MVNKHLIVVSAENNPYMAWQAKLFHFSCLSRMKEVPVFIVHGTENDLHPAFSEIVKASGIVHRVPGRRKTRSGDEYPPRNMAASLIHAAELFGSHEFFLLCDPDMLFVRSRALPETISGDYYSYLNFEKSFVGCARLAMGISEVALAAQREELRCGVPYVIPFSVARSLGEIWLEAIDAFPPRTWEDVMYAFGLAIVKLELRVVLTHMMESNYQPDATLTADIIHYCYGDETWNKRHYFAQDQAGDVWEPKVSAPRETVLGEILSQIVEAKNFYDNISDSVHLNRGLL